MSTTTNETKPPQTEAIKSGNWFWLWSLLWCAAECFVVVMALRGIAGAGNIVKLLAALNVILTPLMLVAICSKSRKPDVRPLAVRHVQTICDVSQALALCWFGWWWCSLSCGLSTLISSAYRYGQNAEAHASATEGSR